MLHFLVGKTTPRASRQKRRKSPSVSKPASGKSSASAKSVHTYLLQLGERLRSVRERRGLTQRQLANQCSLSRRFLVKVEQGRGNLSVTSLHTLARALGVPVESFAAEGQPASPAFE